MNPISRIDGLSEYYDTHDATESVGEVVAANVGRPLDKVVPIRLPAALWEVLRQLASEREVGPNALAREWMIEKLQANKPTLDRSSHEPS